MEWVLFAIGLGMGVIVSVPVGPVNVLCIDRALRAGFLAGLAAGLGGVVADAVFASAALFGLSAVQGLIAEHQRMIAGAGGLILIGFGIAILRRKSGPACSDGGAADHLHAALSGFLVTITNPGALFGFFALYSGLGSYGPEPGNWSEGLALLGGTLTGAGLWWAGLSGIVARHREQIGAGWTRRLNRVAALVLIAFGLFLLGELAYALATGADTLSVIDPQEPS
ncbi:MAG: LysE family transporter [Hyphomicrobiaceae bacterium]|nr:LysE family transporter [Hyphomicrobiaceae bacterium]